MAGQMGVVAGEDLMSTSLSPTNRVAGVVSAIQGVQPGTGSAW